jgi:inner membrane protease subunit 2
MLAAAKRGILNAWPGLWRGFGAGSVVGVGLFGFIHWFNDRVVTLVWVEGGSMRPLFNPHDDAHMSSKKRDVVVVRRWGATTPARGDVVCLWSPTSPNRTIVKRVIGLDGDVVYPRPGGPFSSQTQISQLEPTIEPVVVPPGHCWIEGDNASSSKDSNTYGPIPRALLTGVVSWLAFPTQPTDATQKRNTGLVRTMLPEVRLAI